LQLPEHGEHFVGKRSNPAIIAMFQGFFHDFKAFTGGGMKNTQYLGYRIQVCFYHVSHFCQ